MGLLALAAWLTLGTTVAGEEPSLTVEPTSLTSDGSARAQAVVTVLGADGRPVAGLSQDAFRAELNGEEVPVTAVTRGVDSSLGIAVVLTLDVSMSMQGAALDQAKVAAQGFVDGLGPEDRVAVLAFADGVRVVQPFTTDREAVRNALAGLSAGGVTTLYRAAAESAQLAASSGTARRAVVLLSDGVDFGSQMAPEDVLSTVEGIGVPIFVIGLGTDLDRAFLDALARVSGARFSESPTPEGLAQLYQEVGELLRGHYVLTLDASGVELQETEETTLRVEVLSGDLTGSAERTFGPAGPMVTLRGVEDGEAIRERRTIVAEVLSADPVIAVTFLVDGAPVQQVAQLPYQFDFDPAAFSDGEHTLRVELATATGKTATTEVALRTGAVAAGGGFSMNALAAAAIVASAGLAGAVLLFSLRRRRRGGERPLPPLSPLEPPPAVTEAPAPQPGGLRRMWQETPAAPPPAVEGPLGRVVVVSGGPLGGSVFPVGAAPVSVGSGHRCVVRLPAELDGASIAPEEARVWVRNGQLMVHVLRRLTEMGATGGYWSIVHDGEVFTIGPCTLRFELDGQPSPGAERGGQPREIPNVLRDRDERVTAETPTPAGVGPGAAEAMAGGPSAAEEEAEQAQEGPSVRSGSQERHPEAGDEADESPAESADLWRIPKFRRTG